MTRLLVIGLVLLVFVAPAPADDPTEPVREPPRVDDRPEGPPAAAPAALRRDLPDWLAGRTEENESPAEAAAIEKALEWLALHQSPVGAWDADGFDGQCRLNTCDGAGYALYDVGVTGLALLAYLANGESQTTGPHRESVLRGLKWLMTEQDAEGCIGTRETKRFLYCHALATLAVAEAYGTTRSPFLRVVAQDGVDFLRKAQNPYLAWRYGVRPQDNDTSVTAFAVLALATAKRCGLSVDQAVFDGAKAWMDKVTEPEFGRAGYTARGTGPARDGDAVLRYPADRSEGPTAAAIFTRVLVGENPEKSEIIGKGTDLCLKCLPLWDPQSGQIDMAYWSWGTLALFQVGGDPWRRWWAAARTAAIDHQRRDGDEKGSWDPIGAFGREGGRIYATATMALLLETPRRYAPLFRRANRQ